MNNERKYLEGELKYVEGKTTIKNFIKTLATEMVTQNWMSYDFLETDKAWTFDLRREIWLRAKFQKDHVKLYKATLNPDGSYTKGTEIPSADWTIVNNIIIGLGDPQLSGTYTSDRVLIEVCYEAEEFQRATFLSELLPTGERTYTCRLKSRPIGRVRLSYDTIQKIDKEELHQQGGNEFYTFSRTPVSDSKDAAHKVQVYRNDTLVDESEYVVDFFNGIVMFNHANQASDVIKADYGFKTGLRGAEIPEDKYVMFEDRLIDATATKELKDKDVIVDVDFYWQLHYPTKVEQITDRVVLKTDCDISPTKDRKRLKTYYWELKYIDSATSPLEYKTGIESRFGSTLDTTDDTTLDDKLSSEWAKWSWYRAEGVEADNLVFEDWLPIRYWMNFTTEYANVVIQGDPSPDIHPYKNYLISYAYVGALKSYDNAKKDDLENNFAMTVASDQMPLAESEFPNTWGVRTGTGITDIVMERTDSNIPYQAHYASFYTSPEFMDKHFIHTSEFTGSHHFSEVTVTHTYERERGKLQSMLIGDRSSIFHLDELISNKDDFDYRGALLNNHNAFKNEYGFPFKSEEKRWVMFNINAPYWFANNSPNVFYGVALRKA